MTNTFDWDGLWNELRTAYEAAPMDLIAAAYLRTRIEAAFVPVEDHDERIEWLQRDLVAQNKVAKYCLEARQATARAEAAEARVKVLEEALRHISLGSQNSSTTKEHLGRYARQALGAEHGK